MSKEHLFPYRWKISDGYPAKGIEPTGLKVFGTFICGGGSSMGYKLAGYEHLGGVELDPNVSAIYKDNHHPTYLYTEDLRDFNKREDLPEELYNLDVLDGSPPCSTFSMAGSREKAWGKEKKFAEGQKLQTLDDLVFVYCETINKLKPKVFILENVKGLVLGNAKSYLKRVVQKLDEYGYVSQVFVLNAASMGVPQRRERTFIIGHRKELDFPKLRLEFNEAPIPFKHCINKNNITCDLSENDKALWDAKRPCDKKIAHVNMRQKGSFSGFTRAIWRSWEVIPTVTTTEPILYDFPRRPDFEEIALVGSFPTDYKAQRNKLLWLCGMSVPPVMTAQIAHQIAVQWFKK